MDRIFFLYIKSQLNYSILCIWGCWGSKRQIDFPKVMHSFGQKLFLVFLLWKLRSWASCQACWTFTSLLSGSALLTVSGADLAIFPLHLGLCVCLENQTPFRCFRGKAKSRSHILAAFFVFILGWSCMAVSLSWLSYPLKAALQRTQNIPVPAKQSSCSPPNISLPNPPF